MKVTNYSFTFVKPNVISENEYHSLKDLLVNNQSHNPFKEKTPRYLIFLGIVYFVGIPSIILFGCYEKEILRFNNYIETFIEVIVGIFAFLNFACITQWGTMFSYLSYIDERTKYYSELKNSIINSKNYKEFISSMK